ncbi:MAG: hypothetical protein AB2L21_00010 [Anaerolineaceae bacterium]
MSAEPRVLLTLFLFCLVSFLCQGCQQSDRIDLKSNSDVPDSAWKKLANRRIYFGHMSVGYDIMQGVKDLLAENTKVELTIVESDEASALDNPAFSHSKIGQNKVPKTKVDGFRICMEKGIGGKADIALFKFCYIDVIEETNLEQLFSDYKATMLRLKKAFPQTLFVHVTVPLRTVQTGPRVWIKKIIGKPIGEYVANIRRNAFNDLLRKEYDGKEPIYDLAKVESTLSDGSRSSFVHDGRTYYSLVPAYTYDGGHLNETGRKLAAAQLLLLLASL